MLCAIHSPKIPQLNKPSFVRRPPPPSPSPAAPPHVGGRLLRPVPLSFPGADRLRPLGEEPATLLVAARSGQVRTGRLARARRRRQAQGEFARGAKATPSCSRSRAGWASKDRSTPCIRSRAACASKERSTPEGINMEEHGFRFQFTFPEPDYGEYGADFGEEEECLPRQRKPPEVRNALRQKRVAFRQKTGRHHAKVALRKYNRANNTKFELVEVPVIREFWEFGGGCIHYNFTAKQAEDHHHSADTDSTKLFFSEVNSAFHGEKDVVLCCIVGEHDNGTYLPERLLFSNFCIYMQFLLFLCPALRMCNS
ncbi:uncharacterized protein LOC125529125 [Triticum urartu]|uniref:uncharacterized protein LOC125529125 n=1 Tax=Triticum urartu TaxID=4572 RepID=UPI002042CA23|nr:uncharacterized protein LOC125529125 [Triticum urartu]